MNTEYAAVQLKRTGLYSIQSRLID